MVARCQKRVCAALASWGVWCDAGDVAVVDDVDEDKDCGDDAGDGMWAVLDGVASGGGCGVYVMSSRHDLHVSESVP